MHNYLYAGMAVIFVIAAIYTKLNPIPEPPCEKCGKEVEDCNCTMSLVRSSIEYLDNI